MWRSTLPLGSNGVNARNRGCTSCGCNRDKFKVYGAGGTGGEPAPCGFGALGALSQTVLFSPTMLNIPLRPARYRPMRSRFVPSHCCHYCCQPP
jgi:hypothetical protein